MLCSPRQGDYRTGKRLNMKKIIPYIASEFRKDKIWLRRTKPNQRKYQVVLAIDDSRSMAERRCGHVALEAMTLICRAMARLEVGEVGVVSFGECGNVRALHPLGTPFTDAAGPGLVAHFKFLQENTLADAPVAELLQSLQVRAVLHRWRSSHAIPSLTYQQRRPNTAR
jgi:midasin